MQLLHCRGRPACEHLTMLSAHGKTCLTHSTRLSLWLSVMAVGCTCTQQHPMVVVHSSCAYITQRLNPQHAEFCYFLLGGMEAPGSSQGSGRGPQSTKQGLLCCQEEAAGPQDKGNCQCRTGVSLQSRLYHVSWTVRHVPLMDSVKALPFYVLLASAEPILFLLNYLHSRTLFTPVLNTECPGRVCKPGKHRLQCADRYACNMAASIAPYLSRRGRE